MKKTSFNSKKLLILSLVLVVTLLSIGFTMSALAAESTDNVWTFGEESVKDPLYVQNYFTELPRAFEAELNIPSGSYSGSSPIIANWPNYNTRDAFGFQINSNGKPSIYYYSTSYDVANAKTVTQKDMASFNYNVYGKGWIRLSVVNEIVDGNPIYKLYVNGVLTDTITTFTVVHDFDPVSSQKNTRELSIGNDGKHYFKGELRNVAVYKTLSAEEAAKTAKENMQSGNTNVMAYYDANMSGNRVDLIKDQSGNGHDATKAFFERTEPLNDYAYSFAFIGDIQFLVEKDVNEQTTKYTSPIYDWIVENKTDKNIQHVVGLGDITDNNSDAEWEYAVTLHEKLGEAGINYSIIPGNHDDYTTPAEKYNNYFGNVSSFVDGIDGYYKDGKLENFYNKFEVGEHKYMVIGLQYGATDDVLKWANNVVSNNGDRRVIVITHSLFDMEGNWALPDTAAQTTTKYKELNNGIDIWNKFISLHENIILATAGHITSNIYQPKQYVGVNGNVVNTLLIDPQGFDMATGYDTGFVAIFYFSEDGSEVQVECVSTTKTLRAQAADPNADDVLFHEKNQFSFEIDFTASYIKNTEYGDMPLSVYAAGNKFAVFSNDEFKGGYNTWNLATNAVADMFMENRTAEIQILLLSDYMNKDDGLTAKALSYANGMLTVDLGGYTFTRSGTMFNLNIGSDTSNVSTSNILVKNGCLRSLGKPIINNQISNYSYEKEKIWNLTFEGVTLGYAEGISTGKEVFYSAWTNSATSTQEKGTQTNLTFNNCTFDLKTNVPTTKNAEGETVNAAVTLFKLKDDHSGVDLVDVTVKINGGEILANIDDLEAVTFYTLNEGSDSATFGEYEGAYTKLKTHTTAEDYEHYSAAFPAADGDRYFVEISDNGKESVYELRKIIIRTYEYELSDGSMMRATMDGAKYLSDVDYPGLFDPVSYPFVLFDQTGKYHGAYKRFLGNSDALGSAVYYVVNTNTKPSGNTAYLLMRSDYTLASDEKFDNTSHARGPVVIDMCGYTMTSDARRTVESIFDSTIKYYNANDGVSYFESEYTVRNGNFKIHSSYVIKFKASNTTEEIEAKNMIWNFENVTFGLVQGSKLNGFFHVKTASNSDYSSETPAPMAPLQLTFTDCTIDLKTVAPTPSKNPFYVFKTNYSEGGRIKATLKINGGKVLVNSLDNIDLENFIYGYGSTLTYGVGGDGKYLLVVLDKGESISNFNSERFENAAGTALKFIKVSESITNGTEAYRLRPVALSNVSYSPKMSITLGNEFVMNVYVPMDCTQEFTFDGKKYNADNSFGGNVVVLKEADGSEKNYYHITVSLGSSESAKELKLVATVNIDDIAAKATFTFSIPSYAAKLLDSGTEVEKQLAKDVLAYIKAAYVYFDADNKTEVVNAIDEILGDYNRAFIKTSGETNTENGLWGIVIVLDAKPSIRFVLPEGVTADNYIFKSGNTTLAYTTGTMTIEDKTHNYAEVSLYAYQLIKEITYSDGTNSGSYHINSYYDFVTTNEKHKNDTNLIALVEKLYNYCKSAETYRASVTSK